MYRTNRLSSGIRVIQVVMILIILLLMLVFPAAAQTATPAPEAAPPVNTFLSTFLEQLTLAFAPVLAALLAGWIFAQIKLALSNLRSTRPDIYEIVRWISLTAVKAAEQAGAAGMIADKKKYALDYVQKWLETKGLRIDLTLIDATIEAAVYEEFNRSRNEQTTLPSGPG